MSFPKIFAIFAFFIFGTIGTVAFLKGKKNAELPNKTVLSTPIEIDLDKYMASSEVLAPAPALPELEKPKSKKAKEKALEKACTKNATVIASAPPPPASTADVKPVARPNEVLPEGNRIEELFSIKGPQLPIVETITYKSRVAWQKGRPAWLSDYAGHYRTSRHFIARSLNGKPDYFKQDLAEGGRFNVLRADKNINFYLVVDLSRCKMWLYYHDVDSNDRVLLKTYSVGLGRVDSSKPSGLLTPLGRYSLGDKIAIYKPKMMGHYNGEPAEMIRIFGSRWIPFDKEVGNCTAQAKGFGIHGVPWQINEKGVLTQDCSSLGKYQSDGCLRLASADIEEIFAVVITRPTYVELVKDFHDAALPGVEK